MTQADHSALPYEPALQPVTRTCSGEAKLANTQSSTARELTAPLWLMVTSSFLVLPL